MTAARRTMVGKGSAECRCGEPSQTFAHLLRGCPLTPPHHLPEIEHLAGLPTTRSLSHLLYEGADARDVRACKVSLTRAVRIMCMKELMHEDAQVRNRAQRDPKGHVLVAKEDGSYTFCS